MQKGSRQCSLRSCKRQASGHLLHVRYPWQTGRFYGSAGCQEHLEEATARVLRERLSLSELLLNAAR